MSIGQKIRWKTELKNWLACWDGFRIDNRGFVRHRSRTITGLANKLNTSTMTVHRWLNTGNISRVYKEKLLRMKIVRKDYV